MKRFTTFVYTPAGSADPTLAISACRAGAVGILNTELSNSSTNFQEQLETLQIQTESSFGVKIDSVQSEVLDIISSCSSKKLKWLIVDGELLTSSAVEIGRLRKRGLKILAELTTLNWPDDAPTKDIDGIIVKGNESGGYIGESSSYILFQKWLAQTDLPLYVRGGITPHVASACQALGGAGCVLDNQLLLLKDSPMADKLGPLLGKLSGTEAYAAGNGETGNFFRFLVRPGLTRAQHFASRADGLDRTALKELMIDAIAWEPGANGLLPVGQDVCFAGPWREKYGFLADVLRAIDTAIAEGLPTAVAAQAIAKDSPLSHFFGTDLPIVQGPMSRVSDCCEFAEAVSNEGGLPMLAVGLTKGRSLNELLDKTQTVLADKPWGVGVLGFIPQDLMEDQLSLLKTYKPGFAIIAGGRPDQAVKFKNEGIQAFLHVPSSNLIPLFLQQGARGFIFEGRECGGHIGPLSSFVLWSSMVDSLLLELAEGKVLGHEVQILFAGGIHDAVSSAIVQVLAAPLLELGVQIGIILGSGYIFTKEIVDSGAVLPNYQQQALSCVQTVSLESGPGHSSRCAYTPFASDFFKQSQLLNQNDVPADERRGVLDDLILGRLRIASKGCVRDSKTGKLQQCDEQQQQRDGMFMLGQLAVLRKDIVDIKTLHKQVSQDATTLLKRTARKSRSRKGPKTSQPADIAIIGISTVLPGANTTAEYWTSILEKSVAISEIPAHRWDWRLYYDENRQAKDKIYAKWGGFLDDMTFDPTLYGMVPNSVRSVDPMQLMALEVARLAIADSGYESRTFDRDRTSVIIGASGGAGDVGMQYGLRAEMPRFLGDLPEDVADHLPEWTEDTFAGILLNVLAGRISNRLNLGGVNFTTDAACASSLAAIYQGVNELLSGRSDMILAGGVDTVQGPFGYMCFSKTQALSPRGKCNTLDAEADGIVISEGLAMVVMKRLEDAKRDGDRIYAVIKGIGGSSDGRAKGLTAPLPDGQLRAMKRAYAQAGFGPDTVDLFEAHGTGTVAGDTAEIESTTRLIKEAGGLPHQAALGSVKSVIGHTKATAGIAGMVKAVLALHHRVLPPHTGVSRPNQTLLDETSPFYLLNEPRPWLQRNGLPRRAASSAFGFGGTNFHIALEEYTEEYRPWVGNGLAKDWPAELLVWSAADNAQLVSSISSTLKDVHEAAGNLKTIAYTTCMGFQPDQKMVALVASDLTDLRNKLEQTLNFLEGKLKQLPPGIYFKNEIAGGKIAVLFPGQGSQYTEMLQEVARYFPVCSETLTEADTALAARFEDRFGAGTRLSHFIFPRASYGQEQKAAAEKALTSTDVAQPALGAVEVALWRLLQGFGLKSDMYAGHSYGEYVALFAAEHIDFDTLISLSEARGRCIVDAARAAGSELGTMAAVMAPRDEVSNMIAEIADVNIANHNGPTQSIISGSVAGIRQASQKMTEAGIRVIELSVAAAFHSPFVEAAQAALVEAIEGSLWLPGKTPVYANTTAKKHSRDVAKIKKRMAEHLTKPVEFVSEIESMYRDGARVFVEVGPKSVLSGMTRKILADRPHHTIAVEGDGNGVYGLLCCLAQLLCTGTAIDIAQLFEGRDCKAVSISPPDTAKHSKHTWLLNGSSARRASDPVRHIGVKKGEKRGKTTLLPPAPERLIREEIPESRNYSQPATCRKEGPRMGFKRQPPGPDTPAVMDRYFETMRQFLETQENVMSAYLGMPASGRSAMRPRLEETARPREITVPSELTAKLVAPQHQAPTEQTAPAANSADTLIPTSQPIAPVTAPAAAKALTSKEDLDNGAVDREKMTAMLLAIIEEKTGYPEDMVDLDQNLEADLGIDSIKRIEIVGAIIQALPERYNQMLGEENRTTLNTQATLNGILDVLTSLEHGPKEGALPFDLAGAESITPHASYPFRHIVEATEEALSATAERGLLKGLFWITEDSLGLHEELSRMLVSRGCRTKLIERSLLEDEGSLLQWCATSLDEEMPLGIIHLAALGTEWLSRESSLDDWARQLQINEKSLFILLQSAHRQIEKLAYVLAASGLGGHFGRTLSATDGISIQGGFVGCLKSLLEEQPHVQVRAVDLDLQQPVASLAGSLIAELELVGGRQEVGYPHGKRTIFTTVPAEVDYSRQEIDEIADAVIVATGGLRGITAEVLREFAVACNTFVVLGRSKFPDEEPAELHALATAAELQRYFIGKFKAGDTTLTPSEINKRVASILSAREMRNNLEDFRTRGVTVDYRAIDVTCEKDVAELIAAVYEKYGRLDGVIHGAGIIEDKLLADKTTRSWSRVVDTKVIGLLLLQKYIHPESLRFFSVFSSVAGRYGNSGQSDYATANELMSRLCCQLKGQWPELLAVRSFCWGPWGRTKFGAGMVTAETEAKFSEKGVALVTAEAGRDVFKYDVLSRDGSAVEVICGQGPWEKHEADLGRIRQAAGSTGTHFGPLLRSVTVSKQEKGEQIVSFMFDDRHQYLQEHCIDGIPVVPAAIALDIMAQAATSLWPGWSVVSISDFRLLKGIELKQDNIPFTLSVKPPPYGSSEGFKSTFLLQSHNEGKLRIHYRATLQLAQQLPQISTQQSLARHSEQELTLDTAYNKWLFHGPKFQVITEIDGLSELGALASVKTTRPSEWMTGDEDPAGQWIFDPGLIDSAAQMGLLWARTFWNESALPAYFGQVVRYKNVLPDNLTMHFERVQSDRPHLVHAHVAFCNDDNEVVLEVRDMECISSEALNRLGGTAAVAVPNLNRG